MMTIWKYQVYMPGGSTVEMPSGALILHVSSQTGQDVTLWALVDTEANLESRHFVISGTGHRIEHDMAELLYLGTAILHSMGLVFHIFEVLGKKTDRAGKAA